MSEQLTSTGFVQVCRLDELPVVGAALRRWSTSLVGIAAQPTDPGPLRLRGIARAATAWWTWES